MCAGRATSRSAKSNSSRSARFTNTDSRPCRSWTPRLVEPRPKKKRDELAASYLWLLNNGHINNWDLVDTSAPRVLGGWVATNDPTPILELVSSDELWVRRAGILASFWLIGQGDPSLALTICDQTVTDKRDLIQKASGWALREVGNRCGLEHLRGFLERHAATMPRTMLRYSIEKLEPAERNKWLTARARHFA